MAITTIDAVDLDREEYSQYERDKDTVYVSVFGTPASPNLGDTITIELRKARRNRDVIVAAQTYTFDGAFADFDTVGVEVSFYLPDIRSNPDLIRLMHEGRNFCRVYDTATGLIEKSSDDFDVSIVSVDRLKRDFLFGLDLQAAEVRTWKLPPKLITGVSIVEVSRNHPIAMFSFNYRTDGAVGGLRTLAWAGGDEVPVSSTSRGRYILPGRVGQEYIIVDVNPRALAKTSRSEKMLIEEDQLTDETLRRYLRKAKDHLEHTSLQIFLEPTRCVTDVDPTQITFSQQNLSPIVLDADFDEITQPVTYYPPVSAEWINIQMPMYHILRFDSLFGAVANTRVVDINLEWIEIGEKQGFVQLVPFNQEVAFDFIGLVYVEALRGATEIPSFWRYNLISGLREVPGDIQEYLGREAAIPVLTVAGQAFRSGFSSQSISRDGVSESVSYTASAIYGIYSASIEDHRRWVKDNLSHLRSTYRGMSLWVM